MPFSVVAWTCAPYLRYHILKALDDLPLCMSHIFLACCSGEKTMTLPSIIYLSTSRHLREIAEGFSHELIFDTVKNFEQCVTFPLSLVMVINLFGHNKTKFSNLEFCKWGFKTREIFLLFCNKNPKHSVTGFISNSKLVNTESYEMKKCIFMRKSIRKELHKVLLYRNQSYWRERQRQLYAILM